MGSAIFPTTNQTDVTSNDDRINKLYSFARKVEEDMYNKASTREEYYHMLAEKIYKIQKELEHKREGKIRQEQNGNGPGGPGGPQNNNRPVGPGSVPMNNPNIRPPFNQQNQIGGQNNSAQSGHGQPGHNGHRTNWNNQFQQNNQIGNNHMITNHNQVSTNPTEPKSEPNQIKTEPGFPNFSQPSPANPGLGPG